ncbi:MAG: pro-sigmaK processing inhibitor BofA family protein [Bacilli bacterium]|nr:pro-sigmaK processing inhibitor BofA family protein [Bacilli bacterium]
MKKIIDGLKRIMFSCFLLYGYNLIAINFNLVIPINIFTILFITLLGAPGLFALVLYNLFTL